MNPTEKLGYRLFLEKIFYGIKDIIKKDNKIICISYKGVSIWELYNKNLLFNSFYDNKTIKYKEIIKEIKYENN